ncbi:MAG: hypothetical protein HY683_05160 [Chloroflexi bacterium]|nr:hypothetical protein [Chloroflexota bacterium]
MAPYPYATSLLWECQSIKKRGQLSGAAYSRLRILTNASGPCYTVLTETVFPDVAERDRPASDPCADATFEDRSRRKAALVDSARRALYNVE